MADQEQRQSLWSDIKTLWGGLKEAWAKTQLGADTRAIVDPIKNHLAEVKRINEEIAARDEARWGYEAVTKAKISHHLNEVSRLSIALDAYKAEKRQVVQAGGADAIQKDDKPAAESRIMTDQLELM